MRSINLEIQRGGGSFVDLTFIYLYFSIFKERHNLKITKNLNFVESEKNLFPAFTYNCQYTGG